MLVLTVLLVTRHGAVATAAVAATMVAAAAADVSDWATCVPLPFHCPCHHCPYPHL